MRNIVLVFLVISSAIILKGQSDQINTPEGMVYIPGGTFQMGSDDNKRSIAFPAHTVTVNPFFMETHEVTNEQYHAFCIATGQKFPEFWGMDEFKSGPEFPGYPVLGVSQFDAAKYAAWAGKRLPTEAEWEYAARGGLENRDFPSGRKVDHTMARYNDPEADRGPVETGSYPPNGYGLYDMAGNVWEWTSDRFDAGYYAKSPIDNPMGPETGTFMVIRGGGWHSGAMCITVHRRNALPQHWVDIAGGFRCVKDLD